MIRRQQATAKNAGRNLRWSFCALLSLGLATSVACSKSEDEAGKKSAEPGATAAKGAGNLESKLDHSYLPTKVLAELESLELEGEAPCSLIIDSLRPALSGLADSRRLLEAATTKGAALTLLREASAALSKGAGKIKAASEDEELSRIAAELSASVKDLADGLLEASKALASDDKASSDANLSRMQNGVQNTGATLSSLLQQCAN